MFEGRFTPSSPLNTEYLRGPTASPPRQILEDLVDAVHGVDGLAQEGEGAQESDDEPCSSASSVFVNEMLLTFEDKQVMHRHLFLIIVHALFQIEVRHPQQSKETRARPRLTLAGRQDNEAAQPQMIAI